MLLDAEAATMLPYMQCIQGAKSKTFTPIPLSYEYTIPEMIDFHMDNSPNHPVMVWTKEDKDETVEKIKWAQCGRAVHRIARRIAATLGYDLDKGEQPSKDTHVAIMASGDHQTYIALLMGIIRAGCIVFPLSINNSLAATIHLLKARNCALLIGNAPGILPHLDHIVIESVKEVKCRFLEWIPFEDVFKEDVNNFKRLPPPPKVLNMSSHVMTFHSSGSTSFPKPINISHRSVLFSVAAFNYDKFDISDFTMFLGHLPPFHIMAAFLGLINALGSSVIITLFAPRLPPRLPNPKTTLDAAIKTGTEWMVAPPIFLQLWSEEEDSIRLLQQMKRVSLGGGPLQDKIGNKLVSHGVKLTNIYSATEIGSRFRFDIYEDDPTLWNWNKNIPTIVTYFRPMEDVATSGHYELLLAASERYTPNVINDEYNGVPVFATNDLVILHEKDPSLFQVVGRKDDQIMLSSGEKTNPAPLQPMIERSKYVKSCLYFGRGKPHNGLLVEPVEAINTQDDVQVARFRNLIWKNVEDANTFAPTHSRVFKEMIVIGSEKKPFERTAKGSLRTGIVLQAYNDEIEAAYVAFNQSADVADKVALPSVWDCKQTTAFVHSIVASVLGLDSIDDDDDIFFALGADSLAATRIRNSISASLEKSKKGGLDVQKTRLPTNTVYRHATVNSLSKAVLSLVEGVEESDPDNTASGVAAMEAMLEKYSQSWPKLGGKRKGESDGIVALITGTTGGLGSHTLEKLIRSKKVTKVWALNRSQNGKTPMQRHREAFTDKGLDVLLLEDQKVSLLEADLTKDQLNLDASVYDEIASTVTAVYHLAWRLDFNLSLASFEENIKGSRNLIDVALHSSAEFYFTSSIAVTLQENLSPVKEELLPFTSSIALGYGESKAVTEHLLDRVRRESGLKTCSVRIGQLSGSTVNGYWATTDWVPIMIKSGIALGSLPLRDEDITWMPTDVCAATLLELTAKGSIRHILHPKPVEWNRIMISIAKTLGIETTTPGQWLAALEKAWLKANDETIETIPAVKLFDFFQHQLSTKDATKRESITLDLLSSLAESSALQNTAPLSNKDAEQWISYWKTKHFL